MRRVRLLAVVLLGCLATETAEAYILPSDYIVRMMADKRRRMGIRDLSIQLSTELEGEDVPLGERIYLKNPERFRRIRQNGDDAEVVVQNEGKSARGSDKALERVKGAPLDPLPTLLMPLGDDVDQMQQRILATLERLGVDTSVVSLGRFNDSIAYVIGARQDEMDKPQLWVEKDSFVPMRLRLKHAGEQIELRWLEFGSSATGDWFPRVLEKHVDDERIERSEVEKIDLNKKVPDTLFEIP